MRAGSRGRITLALLGLLVLVLAGWFVRDQLDEAPQAPSVPAEQSQLPVRPLSTLPGEAASTWRLIQDGGPFPYRTDGIEYENREKVLPRKESGYYHEFTVRTPGSPDRGTRRLVTGSGQELYYTEDHYRSFVRVDPNR